MLEMSQLETGLCEGTPGLLRNLVGNSSWLRPWSAQRSGWEHAGEVDSFQLARGHCEDTGLVHEGNWGRWR